MVLNEFFQALHIKFFPSRIFKIAPSYVSNVNAGTNDHVHCISFKAKYMLSNSLNICYRIYMEHIEANVLGTSNNLIKR